MQQQYALYYRQYGIRRLQQLNNPNLFPIEQFHFPRSATFHFVSHDDSILTPDSSQPYFHHYSKRIMMDIVNELTSSKGNPRKKNLMLQTLYSRFFRKNKLFKFMREPEQTIHDPSTLIVDDYGYLQALYRYSDMPMTDYYKWANIETTVWQNMDRIASLNDRQHFIFVNVPDVLPSVATLRMFADKENVAMKRMFNTPEKLLLREFWKWIDEEHRDLSVISKVKTENLAKINLVMVHRGQWCVLNLAVFDGWRKDPKASDEEDKEDADKSHTKKQGVKYAPVMLQKIFLKFLIQVQSAVGEDLKETQDAEATNPEDSSNREEIESDDTDQAEIKQRPEESPKVKETDTKFPDAGYQTTAKDEIVEPEPHIDDAGLDDSLFAGIDEDLKALEFIETKHLMLQGVHDFKEGFDYGTDIQIKPVENFEISDQDHQKLFDEIFTEKDPLVSLFEAIDRHAEYGLMSAADYRAATKQAERFMGSNDPFDSQVPISDFVKIPVESLKIKESDKKFPDLNIPDKSMLISSLKTFDSKYISDVMSKDIVAMVTSIQRAGIIIQDYTIEKDNTVLGESHKHILRVKPIDGVASTIQFTLPVVNADGTFFAGGNKYHMRKQRGDCPIRKINPHTVSLSSYYGKVFVSRSVKKVNDSISWLANQILTIGQLGESNHITEVAPANVFDNEFKAPRIYSGLAQNFKSLNIGPYKLILDHNERLKMFEDDGGRGLTAQGKVNSIESNDKHQLAYRIIGTSPGGLLLVDFDDQFFSFENGSLNSLGDIYSLSLIDQTRAPIDFTELRVMAKTIPIGIVLAYVMGFTNLIKFLRVKPRVFEARQRVVLESHEWVITFKDKKYVFSRKNRTATLVLGGFNEYWKSIKNYFVESFDQKNVYLNVLESAGIGTRYLRELENLEQMFIDPITRDILVEMKQPLTFNGLLVKACTMLLEDDHPDSQDMTVMRIKGYERFAGAVYRELTMSVKDYKYRNIRGKSRVELNPYSVWQGITQDSSVEIVKDINPMENLKQNESVTYVGAGGRTKDAMGAKSRAFHISDVGMISEATVESGDVGINAFLSANPNFTSLRGISAPYDPKKQGITGILSSTALSAPGSDHDDPKRVKTL